MQIVININENEFGIDIENKFQDFFKRLQAEIQSRLISNDTLVCGVYELETIEMFMTAFKNATIEQEPKWIPCSERLPEDRELVLLSTVTDDVFEGRFFDDNTDCQWYAFRPDAIVSNHVVTAWMPLPNAYKEVDV